MARIDNQLLEKYQYLDVVVKAKLIKIENIESIYQRINNDASPKKKEGVLKNRAHTFQQISYKHLAREYDESIPLREINKGLPSPSKKKVVSNSIKSLKSLKFKSTSTDEEGSNGSDNDRESADNKKVKKETEFSPQKDLQVKFMENIVYLSSYNLKNRRPNIIEKQPPSESTTPAS